MPPGGAPNTPPNGPPPSDIQTREPAVGFQVDKISPSQYVYTQDNDLLNIVLVSNAANQSVTVRFRYLTPQGEIKETTRIISTLAALVVFPNPIPLSEGWLVSVALQRNTFVTGSWVFAQIAIQRQVLFLSFLSYGLLWSGFITFNSFNGWPGMPSKEITDGPGQIRSITGTTPAAGADISELVPALRRWTLLTFHALLTTSVAVANRAVELRVDDGVNILVDGGAFSNQAASSTAFYSATATPNNLASLDGVILLSMPLPLALDAGFHIKTVTTNLQAADQWTAPQYMVLEWGEF